MKKTTRLQRQLDDLADRLVDRVRERIAANPDAYQLDETDEKRLYTFAGGLSPVLRLSPADRERAEEGLFAAADRVADALPQFAVLSLVHHSVSAWRQNGVSPSVSASVTSSPRARARVTSSGTV